MNTEATSSSPKTSASDDLLVRKDMFVNATPERCFDVFTKQMGTWWPLGSHHIGKVDAKDVAIEPKVGGRVYEIGVDGSECVWGHVKAWEPPGRFVFSWELSASFQFDASIDTEVEVRFTAENSGTRMELVHRGLRAYGAQAEEMRKTFDSPGGWTGLLEAFRARVTA